MPHSLANNNLVSETNYVKASKVQGGSKEVGAKVIYQGREMTVSKGVDGDEKLRMGDFSGIVAIAEALQSNSSLTNIKCVAITRISNLRRRIKSKPTHMHLGANDTENHSHCQHPLTFSPDVSRNSLTFSVLGSVSTATVWDQRAQSTCLGHSRSTRPSRISSAPRTESNLPLGLDCEWFTLSAPPDAICTMLLTSH